MKNSQSHFFSKASGFRPWSQTPGSWTTCWPAVTVTTEQNVKVISGRHRRFYCSKLKRLLFKVPFSKPSTLELNSHTWWSVYAFPQQFRFTTHYGWSASASPSSHHTERHSESRTPTTAPLTVFCPLGVTLCSCAIQEIWIQRLLKCVFFLSKILAEELKRQVGPEFPPQQWIWDTGPSTTGFQRFVFVPVPALSKSDVYS